MDRALVLHELDRERRSSFPARVEGEVLPGLTRLHGRDSDWYCVAFSCLDEGNAERAIREQAAHYRALNVEVEWKVYSHDTPFDLRHRLADHGFVAGARESVLVLDLAARHAWLDEPARHRVMRVLTAEHVEIFQRLASEVFGDGQQGMGREILRHIARGSTELLAYIGFYGEVAASVGRLDSHRESAFGSLYGGATLDPYRGRGLYAAVVAARARDALQLGARYLRVDALPTSEPILERLGFVKLADTWPCVLPALR